MPKFYSEIQMKRICLISDRNVYIKRFCRLLTDNGYKIAIICRHQSGLDKSQFPVDIEFYQLSSTSLIKKTFEISSILKTYKPDIVHLHYLAKDCIIPVLNLRRSYKYYISIWGSDINLFSKNFVNRIIQNMGLLLCDKIHLLSPYFENMIKNLFFFIKKSKYNIFSWGVDYTFLINPKKEEITQIKSEYKINNNDHIILSYRNHKEIYNHHTLLKAMPQVIEEFPNTKFIFTRGSYSENYRDQTFKLANDLGVQDHFIFINRWLTNNELRALINIADINVNIPLKDGLPATLFEIMSTKAIPIVSNLDNYHPFFQDKTNGFYLHKIDDAQELSELIKISLRNLDFYKEKFHSVNNDYIRNYQNWKIQSKHFLEFYN